MSDEHTLFSGRTEAGNPFTVFADPNMSPETRTALEKMVDLANQHRDYLIEFCQVPRELMVEDPKHLTSGWAKRRKMRGL